MKSNDWAESAAKTVIGLAVRHIATGDRQQLIISAAEAIRAAAEAEIEAVTRERDTARRALLEQSDSCCGMGDCR